MTISRNHAINSVIMGGFVGRTSKKNTHERSTISIIRMGTLNPVKDYFARTDSLGIGFTGKDLIIGGSPG